MEYIALCASLFLKNALISERKFVTLCTGIGLSFLLFCHYKDTHFLQQTEIPMPFLCTNTSYYCQLAKLELLTLNYVSMLKNISLRLCTLIVLLLTGTTLFAQRIQVKGKVVEKLTGESIIGASVLELGSNSNGAITDLDGYYDSHFKLKSKIWKA